MHSIVVYRLVISKFECMFERLLVHYKCVFIQLLLLFNRKCFTSASFMVGWLVVLGLTAL